MTGPAEASSAVSPAAVPPAAVPPAAVSPAAVEQAGQAYVRVANRALLALPAPVTAPQLRALLIVQQSPGVSMGVLAAQLGVKPPTATQLCDRLEAAGLLDRQPAAHSRRVVLLRLTPAGRRLLAGLARVRRDDLAQVLARMTEPEQAALLTGLLAFTRGAAPDQE